MRIRTLLTTLAATGAVAGGGAAIASAASTTSTATKAPTTTTAPGKTAPAQGARPYGRAGGSSKNCPNM
jgi:hypothetical protein